MADALEQGPKSSWHHGTLGCFLEDEDGNLYGFTCKHVTNSAGDGIIYSQDFFAFGKVIPKTVHLNTFSIFKDVDLFLIHKEFHSGCCGLILNSKGESCEVIPLDLTEKMKHEQEIYFIWRNLSECIEFNILSTDKIKDQVLPEESGRAFLIDSTDVKEGDSGSAVLTEKENKLLIVGFVVGGKVLIEDKNFCLGIEYQHGLNMLEHDYSKKFKIPSAKGKSVIKRTTSNRHPFYPSSVILILTPEDIKKSDFDLSEQMILLIDCHENLTCFSKCSVTFENMLSRYVSSRKKDIQNIKYSTADEQCYRECMIGCDFLYSGEEKLAEEHFKKAIRIVPKTQNKAQLLCHLITYITWLLLKGNLDKMIKLLQTCESYLSKMGNCGGCSFKTVGFYYFDFARYYKMKDNISNSLKMAYKSLEYFERAKKLSTIPVVGKCFALAMIARLNLNCGYNFETRHKSMRDISEAESALQDISEMNRVEQLPVAEYTTYLIIKSDLEYRKGDVKKAMKLATDSHYLAVNNKLTQEQKEANDRIKILGSILKHGGHR